jgi:hypothetical protein
MGLSLCSVASANGRPHTGPLQALYNANVANSWRFRSWTALKLLPLVPCMLTSVLLFIGVAFTLDTVHLSDDSSNFPLHFGQAYPKTCKCCGNLTFT